MIDLDDDKESKNEDYSESRSKEGKESKGSKNDKDDPSIINWVKPPSLIDLKADYSAAKPIHSAQVTKIKGWLDNLNITGSAKITATKGNSSIQPKLIRRQAEWRYAALSEPFLSTEDIFSVKPVTWEDTKAAQQNQLLLNHQFNNKIDKVKFVDEYVRTAVDEGTIIIQVGWEFEEEEVEIEEPIVEFRVNMEVGPLHEYIAKLKEDSPSEYDTNVPDELKQAHDLTIEQGRPIEPVITGQRTVTKMRAIKNQPTLEICDFRNILMDPTAMGDVDKSNFMIKHFETCKSDLLKSGKKYFDLDKIQVSNNSVLGTPDHEILNGTQTFNYSEDALKKFIAYEYWGKRDIDGKGTVKTIVVTWVGDVIIRMEETPFADKGLPFIVEHYLPVRKSNYGEPDGALLEDNQKIIGAVTRGMIDIMGKSANGQTGISNGMLDITNRRKFDKGMDYEFNPNIDPRQGIYMHTYPEIPQSAPFMLQLQNNEAEALTGVQSFSQGISGAALGDVAAGVRGALDAASKRELGILRRLSSGIIKIGRKLISMNAEFLSDEEVVRVTNDDFVKVRREDLAGSFDLKLSISTAEEDNNKAEQMAFMLQTTGAILGPELTKVILGDIARLRKLPDLAHRIETFQPKPDELAQKKAELEIALLEAQIATEQSKALMNKANANLDNAKIGTETNKQDNLKSTTDLNNLNFVEQESGVKQERDIQKVGEQARSQGDLKVLDHKLNMDAKDTDLLNEYISRQVIN